MIVSKFESLNIEVEIIKNSSSTFKPGRKILAKIFINGENTSSDWELRCGSEDCDTILALSKTLQQLPIDIELAIANCKENLTQFDRDDSQHIFTLTYVINELIEYRKKAITSSVVLPARHVVQKFKINTVLQGEKHESFAFNLGRIGFLQVLGELRNLLEDFTICLQSQQICQATSQAKTILALSNNLLFCCYIYFDFAQPLLTHSLRYGEPDVETIEAAKAKFKVRMACFCENLKPKFIHVPELED